MANAQIPMQLGVATADHIHNYINWFNKFNQFAFHLSNPLTRFVRNIFLKRLVKNKKFLESYLGKIYR